MFSFCTQSFFFMFVLARAVIMCGREGVEWVLNQCSFMASFQNYLPTHNFI